jgi:hypothetical protein
MGEVVHAGSNRGDGSIIFRGKCECVIDAVGIAVHAVPVGKAGKRRETFHLLPAYVPVLSVSLVMVFREAYVSGD